MRQSMRIIREGKKYGYEGRVLPILLGHCPLIFFTGAETEIHKIEDDSIIKTQTNLDRRGPRTIPIVCHLPDPPSFVTDYLYTKKKIVRKFKQKYELI